MLYERRHNGHIDTVAVAVFIAATEAFAKAAVLIASTRFMIRLLSHPAGRNIEGMNDLLCRRGRAIGCRISSDAAVEHEAEQPRCRSVTAISPATRIVRLRSGPGTPLFSQDSSQN
jgi:hypothetical protein